mmetsp:Transcript_29109/g.41179  ORF Transcript_29109/g.41179 Transcript_29109/m.41179 type:complete len:550 (+) Transcript_29109:180-1829(+)
MCYRMYYRGDAIDPEFPAPKLPKEIYLATERPHPSAIITVTPGGTLVMSATRSNPGKGTSVNTLITTANNIPRHHHYNNNTSTSVSDTTTKLDDDDDDAVVDNDNDVSLNDDVVVSGGGGSNLTAEDRRQMLKEVREHLDLLKEFDGVISSEEIANRKRQLFLALPPAPPPAISTAVSQQQQQQQHYHQNGNLTGEPATKRLKESVSPAGAPLYATAPVGPATAAAGLAPATNAPISKGAISGRLGFSVVAGQIKQAQPMTVARQPAAATGVALPVGVGIRLGGVGGVAPATAQLGPRGLHAPWGINSAGALSDKAVAERRQRNREHAKRSRVRKKFMLESLQGQVRELQKENLELRMLIQEKIPQHAQQIISECCGKNSLFADPDAIMTDADGEKKKETALVKSDFSLIESLTSGQQNFVLSDPRLPDNPIVYASPGFYDLTGYTQDQVLGRNCRFLQGPGTDPRAVDIIRKAIANGSDSTTCILNYKADGTPFWNQFFVAALRDSDNCIVNYVGVQCEVEPEAGSSALEDKVNSVLPLQQKEGEEGM